MPPARAPSPPVTIAFVNIVVFGASGRTGLLLVRRALDLGHAVTVLVPSSRSGELPAAVNVVHGSVLDGGAVSDAVHSRHAAIVALQDADEKAERQGVAQGTLNVVRSMQRYGARRLIVLSSSLAHRGPDPDQPWLREHLIKPLLQKKLADRTRRTEVIVRQSELDWTLVRVTSLKDGPADGRYRVGPGFSLPGSSSIARADVAAFMLDELSRGDNVAHAVALSS